MASGFTVKIEDEATYRVVPEDPRKGHGINVPFFASNAGLRPDMRMDLREGGWAEYDRRGRLDRVHVPEGWRLEQWEPGKEQTFDEVRGE